LFGQLFAKGIEIYKHVKNTRRKMQCHTESRIMAKHIKMENLF
jgi:hypothetical protein